MNLSKKERECFDYLGIIEDSEGIDCLADIQFHGQAKDYIDFLVFKGYEDTLFFYIINGIRLGQFTWDNLDEYVIDNIFPISFYLNYRFNNVDFKKFLSERCV